MKGENLKMMEQKQRKKPGPKPIYGEAKKMVSFRLSPEALSIIKSLADKENLSQAEVIERWARLFRNSNTTQQPSTFNLSDNREFAGAQR